MSLSAAMWGLGSGVVSSLVGSAIWARLHPNATTVIAVQPVIVTINPPPRQPAPHQGAGSADSDPWGEMVMVAVCLAIAAVAFVRIAPPLLTGAMWFSGSAALTTTLLGWRYLRAQLLPVGGTSALVRAATLQVVVLVCFAWITQVTYGGVTLEEMHDKLHRVPFAESTAALSENFHGEGWSLAVTLMLGVAAAVVVLVSSFRDTIAVFASVSLATGRQGRLTQRLAATHDHRQGGWWAIQGFLAALALFLCTGAFGTAARRGDSG